MTAGHSFFERIYGHDEVKRRLTCMLSKDLIGHALLFVGRDGIGKSLIADAIVADILARESSGEEHLRKFRSGRHPDVHYFRPEGKSGLHSVQSMRRLIEEIFMPPYEASRKVFIVYEADRMSAYSANALLKTFEEPSPRTIVILIGGSETTFLPTIVSRCRLVHFSPLPLAIVVQFLIDRYGFDQSICTNIAIRAQGSIGQAVRLAEGGDGSMRMRIMGLLIRPPSGNYRELRDTLESVTTEIETMRKKIESEIKSETGKNYPDQPSALHRQSIENDSEGVLSLAISREVQSIFGIVLSWYRDLQLLAIGGSPSLLMNPDLQKELEESITRKDTLPLEEVNRAVKDADLAFRRSTSPALCLETLFLKIGRVS